MPNVAIKWTYVVQKQKKDPIEIDGWNHYTGDKREGHKLAKICMTYRNQRRERPSPSRGRKLFHPQPL